ncbi:copper chaperone PCu(A)C [Ruegeria litorea]|uniref:Copper chaperone PCu(A)C n=1 Tax=Falsiruegeria litorea TaxID=1280831 RepID=A0ABS5WUL8_9RHOB|nr:copper chaperone PCu(A)C [Falsiruegeria litorea]MBT3142751.1 copper chaperone PCu(A)C [Falsiruegeria litorea]
MSFRSILFTAVATLGLTTSAFAADVMVKDAYARSAGKNAKTGAAFMMIMNHGAENDRLINATSDVAKRVELHTHKENGDGVMQMLHVEEGFAIPAGEMHPLKRGGDHVMFMGLNQPFVQGEMIPVTLVFEKAGEVKVEIPVDLERKPAEGGMSHGTHKN